MKSLIKKECESVLNELLKFSDDILSLGKPISDERLEHFERDINYEFPFDFKYFLKKFNGFSLCGVEVFGLGNEFKESSLDRIYDFEHSQIENKMPSQFLPFSNDGRGNHYCLDLSRLNEEKICPIVFWQWDFKYKSITDVETCNESFGDWVEEVMIEWAKEDYNYDGTEK